MASTTRRSGRQQSRRYWRERLVHAPEEKDNQDEATHGASIVIDRLRAIFRACANCAGRGDRADAILNHRGCAMRQLKAQWTDEGIVLRGTGTISIGESPS